MMEIIWTALGFEYEILRYPGLGFGHIICKILNNRKDGDGKLARIQGNSSAESPGFLRSLHPDVRFRSSDRINPRF